jgi:peroxiredoxin
MSLLGTSAPNFNLFDTDRNQIALDGLRGKKVVLAFFPAAFTGVCEKELCTFESGLSGFEALGATVLGISVDAPFSNAAFASKTGATFPILSDYSRSTVEAYGVALNDFAGMPGYTASQRAVFIIDEEGNVSYEWIAPNPGVEPNYDEVKAALA